MKSKKQIKIEIKILESDLDLLNEDYADAVGQLERQLLRLAKNACKKQIEILKWVLNG